VVLVSDLTQAHFSVPAGVADAVANLLTERLGGIEQRDADTLAPADKGQVEFVAWVPSSDVSEHVRAVEHLLSSLNQLGDDAAPFSWHTEEADPDSWVEAYKKHFKTNRLGRFVIKPSWEDAELEPGELSIEIDPGMAFGTGLHASTRLALSCLARVARLCPPPEAVLDLGCGTGILAIAAAKLWSATRVVAVDIDEAAVASCRENVERNDLGGRIEVQQRAAAKASGRFGLVLANLSEEVLLKLRPTLPKRLDEFGRLVLSGLLAEQAPGVCRAYTRALALEPEYSEEDSGWRALLLRTHL